MVESDGDFDHFDADADDDATKGGWIAALLSHTRQPARVGQN